MKGCRADYAHLLHLINFQRSTLNPDFIGKRLI
jgi:hypothetical protein